MQVIFIHHSCFLVEVDDKVLIFDYFAGDRVKGYTFQGKIPSYEPDTKIYMFASHSHQDHFDMDILRWSEQYTNIKYILSKDIRISPNFLRKHGIDPAVRDRVTFVTGGKRYKVDDLEIETLTSTDAGVAFYVTTGGVSLFHAGDLSDWRMEGAGDLINGKMQRSYRHEKSQSAPALPARKFRTFRKRRIEALYFAIIGLAVASSDKLKLCPESPEAVCRSEDVLGACDIHNPAHAARKSSRNE